MRAASAVLSGRRNVSPFIITVDTTKAGSANDTFVLPLPAGFTYNCVVDWGDDSTTKVTAAGNISHQYDASGTYQVSVSGTVPSISFNNVGDKLKLISIDNFGSSLTSLNAAFHGCANLVSMSKDGDTSDIVNFTSAWQNCTGLTSFPEIDTAKGITFIRAWEGCTGLTSFPVLDLTGALNLFYAWIGCTGLTSFPLIDTSNATNLEGTWRNCTGLTSFPLIDTSNATNFGGAWLGCTKLTSFPLIDTSNATNFGGAWQNCTGLTSFPEINTAKGITFTNTWRACTSLTSFPTLDFALATTFSLTWFGSNKITTSPSTICANMVDGKVTNVGDTFEGCTAMTGQSYKFWNWTTPPTTTADCYLNCTGLDDYATIPAAYL
jgi:hypothetical protein